MRPTIDFKECLKDSPGFRSSLDCAETDLEILEARLERMVKLCTLMIDTGKSFKKASSDFVIGVRDLASYFKDDDMVTNCLNKFAHEMTEMLKYFTILMDQANRTVCKNLMNFIKNDVKKVKDSRKDFEKISDELDNALNRNANASRTKPQECEEANNLLKAKQSCFSHASLDYVFQINILHSKKRFDILETMLSFIHAQNTFFHQGHELFKEFEPEMKCVATQVEELSAKAGQERKEMEERHTLVQQKEVNDNELEDNNGTRKVEGYLFKRTSRGFKNWVRRWFMIKDSQLVYKKRSSGGKDSQSIMEEDLRLCTVKPLIDIDRRFCFEVVSPVGNHWLQADTNTDCQTWITEIQNGISNAFRQQTSIDLPQTEEEENRGPAPVPDSVNMSSTPQPLKQSKAQQRMEQLLSIPGNNRCCDCGSAEPRWTSINLGITLCIECSGIHRSFGVHLSKVRSITLDAWEPELLKVMAELGNDVINRIYEANVDESIAVKATPDCKRSVRESWIRSKYIEKAFVMKLPGPKTSGNKAKGWSVKKKIKRLSPSRSLSKDESDPESDVTSGLMEAVLSVSHSSKDCDSGLGASSTDVIVFGDSEIEVPDLSHSIDLESSEDSIDETEDGDDTKSTTSWEDMSKLDPNMLLYKAAQARNLPVMLEALANNADPNWVHEDEEGRTPIMKVVETGSLAACEFLLLNGAKLDKVDKKGRTPLHHATMNGNTGQVCQFLKRGANLHAKDENGQDPLDIAVTAADADIVTLLRLAKLNEEMKESDGGFGNPDDTFSDVFRDFSNMASNNPEKLKRNQSST